MPLTPLRLTNQNVPADYFTSVRDKFDLNPPYQRGSVWTDAQRERLMRSLWLGLPIGAITINFRASSGGAPRYAVVDGKQRIETLRAFVDDQFCVPVEWFATDRPERGALNPKPGDVTFSGAPGVRFSGLSRYHQATVLDFGINVQRAEVKSIAAEAELFDLLNSAGTAQTDTDLRRAREVATGD